MEINGTSGNINRYSQQSQNTARQPADNNEIYEASQSSEPTQLTEKEEMELFKKNLKAEISVIYGKSSSSVLSNSLHITDDALEKMKSDPKFKDEMMEALRKEVSESRKLPYKANITTKIGIDGYSSLTANISKEDNEETIADKNAVAKKKARGAFFHRIDNPDDVSEKKLDSGKSWLTLRREQQIYEMGIREKNVLERSRKRTSFIRTF